MADGVLPPFVEFVAQVEEGRLAHDATDKLRELVAEMNRHSLRGVQKVKGRLTIAFDMIQEGDIVEVRGRIELKKPALARLKSMFFPTKDGDLSLSNPKQLDAFHDAPPREAPRDVLPIRQPVAAERP